MGKGLFFFIMVVGCVHGELVYKPDKSRNYGVGWFFWRELTLFDFHL